MTARGAVRRLLGRTLTPLAILALLPSVAQGAGEASGSEASSSDRDVRACQFALFAENDIGEDVWILFSESHVNNNAGLTFVGTDHFEDMSNRRVAPGKRLNVRYEVKGGCGAPRQWFMTVRIGPRGGEKILVLRITDSENERDIYLGHASCWALAPTWDSPSTDRVVGNDEEAAGCDPTTTKYGLAPEGDDEGGGEEGTEGPVAETGGSIEMGSLQGNWRRLDSNNARNDGMRAVVQGRQATLTFIPPGGSRRFSEGNLLWRDIGSDGSLQVRGSDGAYHSARLTMEGEDRIDIDIDSNGPGNDQTWERSGPAIDGEWVLETSPDGQNEGMRIRVEGDEATLRYLPAAAGGQYRVGDVLWEDIGRESLRALTSTRTYTAAGYHLSTAERLRVEVDGGIQLWVRPGTVVGPEDPSGGEEGGDGAGDGDTDEDGADIAGSACVSTSLVDDVLNVAWGWGLTESDPDPGSVLSALPAWEAVPEQSRRVIDVDRSRVEGLGDHYALIWEANTGGLDWEVERGLSPGEFLDRQEAYEERGLRLTDLEIDEIYGAPTASAIWMENIEGIDWDYDTVVSPDDVDGVIERRRALGYRLADIEAFETNGQWLLAAVWHRSCAGADWDYVANVDRDTYQDRLDAAMAQGLYMVDFESWMTSSGQRYAAIFEAPLVDREFRARSGRDLEAFLNFHRRYVDQGFRLIDYESYEEEDGIRYAGIWVENDARWRDPVRPVLDTLIQTFQDSTYVPGMSVVVIEDGEVIYGRGFGEADRDTQKWAWSGTVYLTASVSKVVGATLAARLEERLDDFDLSRPTADYLVPALDYVRDDAPSGSACTQTPDVWFCEALPDHHTHTVEQLLAKTGCIPHYNSQNTYEPPEEFYRWRAEALDSVWDNPLISGCTPGQTYRYSTPGFSFVGAVLESQTGTDIATLIENEVSGPLGLTTLRAMSTESGLRPDYDRAAPYELQQPGRDGSGNPDTLWVRADPVQNPNNDARYDDSSWKVLGGGIESSAMDLARFGWATIDGQIAADPGRMWSSRTSGATTMNGNPAPVVGLAWELAGTFVDHGGSWAGAGAHLLLATNQGVSVAILANRRRLQMVRYFSSGHGIRGLGTLADEIMDLVLSR